MSDAKKKPADNAAVPIVAIGSSAGGLEALETLLHHMPLDSGAALVIIQHQDPTHKGMLVELLQRATLMPVQAATDQKAVEANNVYVIPPNKDLSLLHGKLLTFEPQAPRGMRLPINAFFSALEIDPSDDQARFNLEWTLRNATTQRPEPGPEGVSQPEAADPATKTEPSRQ